MFDDQFLFVDPTSAFHRVRAGLRERLESGGGESGGESGGGESGEGESGEGESGGGV